MIRQPPRSTRTDTRLPDTSFFRSKRTRDMPDMRWAFDMASMLQVSLVAFMAAGAFLPMSYFDLSYQLMALSAVLAAFCVQQIRSEEHTSELQSLMRSSYAVFCLKKKYYNILL